VALSTSGSLVLFDSIVMNIGNLYPQLTVEWGVHYSRKLGIIHRVLRMEFNSPTLLHNPRAVIVADSDTLVTFKFEAMFIPRVCEHLPAESHINSQKIFFRHTHYNALYVSTSLAYAFNLSLRVICASTPFLLAILSSMS